MNETRKKKSSKKKNGFVIRNPNVGSDVTKDRRRRFDEAELHVESVDEREEGEEEGEEEGRESSGNTVKTTEGW